MSVSLEDFPPELLKEVFKNFNYRDLSKAATICLRWRELAEDPSLWSDFPVKLTIGNMDSFFAIKRLKRVRRVEIQLPVCTVEECEDHPEKQWPILNQISSHMAPHLEEIIIRGAACNVANPKIQWIHAFGKERMEQGITICMIWPEPDGVKASFAFYLPAATSESRLMEDLMTRTVRGEESPVIIDDINIYGDQDAASSLPANFFQVLSTLAEEFFLATDYKIKSLDLDHLKNCVALNLYNKAPTEDKEVGAWEGIIDRVAQLPRPENPKFITLPKALFLRTTWAQRMERLGVSNTVGGCEEDEDCYCEGQGCIRIDFLDD